MRMEEYCREIKAYLIQLEGGQNGSFFFFFPLISCASGNVDKQQNAES